MFKHLKALWHLPEMIDQLHQDVNSWSNLILNEPYLASGLRIGEQDRQMIRAVHNLITVRLEGYLQAENARTEAEAMDKMKVHAKTILEKGEKLTGTDFTEKDMIF